MYNLTIDTAHTFFVGEGQWLVHNDCENEIALAQKLQEAVGNTGRNNPTIALSANGTLTHSGWKKRLGFSQGTDQAMGLARNMGFEFPGVSKYDQGVPGRYHASHVEAQMGALAPGRPMAVSNSMCSTCQDFLSRLAQYRQEIQVVADPYMTRVFYPSGVICGVR